MGNQNNYSLILKNFLSTELITKEQKNDARQKRDIY